MEKIKSILRTKTLKQTSLTFSTTVINGALGAVFYIIAARVLGPASFGILSVAITVLMLGTSIAGLGVNTGLVRFVSKYRISKPQRANRFLKLSLKANLLIGFAVLVIGLISAEFIAFQVFAKPELVEPLRVSSLGVLALLMFGFSTRYLEAFQKFRTWGLLQIGTNLARIIVVFLIILLGTFTLRSGIWIYAMIPLIGFIFAFLFIIPHDFINVKNETRVSKEFFQYNKWVALFTLVAALSSRMDTFIVTRAVSAEQLGLYAAAYQLVYIVPQIIGALGTVIAPKMASMGSLADFYDFFKKTQMLVLGLAFLGLLAGPVVALVVPLLFGAEYSASVPVFYLLLASMLVFLVSVPVHNAVLYYFSYPKLFFWLGVGHLLIVTSVAWFLSGQYGIMGAGLAVLIGSIFNLIVPAGWVYRKVRAL